MVNLRGINNFFVMYLNRKNFPFISLGLFTTVVTSLSSARAADPASLSDLSDSKLINYSISQAVPNNSSTLEELKQENVELKARIDRLEKLLDVKSTDQNKVLANAKSLTPVIPKDGFYIQGDIGGQHRNSAGENGYTVTYFQPGFYSNIGVGYRYKSNFRFSAEYAYLPSKVSKVSACYSTPPYACGYTKNDGVPFPGNGTIYLNQYTLNAYYDLDGFGYKKRFRPYVGLGVGTEKSTISGLTNTQAVPYGLYANGSAWSPLVTFMGGLSYVVSKNAELFVGGKYALGSELLFRNTDFGDLLPQSSRNWIMSGGFRYTF